MIEKIVLARRYQQTVQRAIEWRVDRTPTSAYTCLSDQFDDRTWCLWITWLPQDKRLSVESDLINLLKQIEESWWNAARELRNKFAISKVSEYIYWSNDHIYAELLYSGLIFRYVLKNNKWTHAGPLVPESSPRVDQGFRQTLQRNQAWMIQTVDQIRQGLGD